MNNGGDMASSMGSGASSQSLKERMNNTKHFTEYARLEEVIKLYTTLEGDNKNNDIMTNTYHAFGKNSSSKGAEGGGSGDRETPD
jgi:hypothetical protein